MKPVPFVLVALVLSACNTSELSLPDSDLGSDQAGPSADLAQAAVAVVSDPSTWSTHPVGVPLGERNDLYELGVDPTVAHEGGASAYIRALPAAANVSGAWGTFKQEMSPTPFIGKRLRMSGWVKTQATTYAGMWFAVDGAQLRNISIDNMRDRPIGGTTDWTYYEDVLDVPATAVNLRFGLLLAGEGEAFIDDVRFDVVDDSVPTTATSSSP